MPSGLGLLMWKLKRERTRARVCVFTHMHVQALSVNGSGLQKVPWRDSSVNSCCSNKVHL